MASRSRVGQWSWKGIAGLALVAGLAMGIGGCNRNNSGQLPTPSGAPIAAKAEKVSEFTLVRAYPDQKGDGVSLALEFSRPLVGTQDFDALVRFAEKVGTEDSSWTLSDDGLTLRYPFVEAAKEYNLIVSPDLLAADGSRIGKELRQKVFTGELKP
ncbi:hypothetical protein, partial [Stenotrophomonas sp. HMWF003]